VQQAGWTQTTPTPADVIITTSGQVVPPVNFGNFKLITISGTKFEDIDGDGSRGPAEPALPNWVIFLDNNDNGVLDAGEPNVTTPGSGAYSFGPLGPGTYHVREVLRPGWTQTLGVPTVVAVSGQDVSADIGNFQNYSLSGQVFHDVNGNA